MILSILKFFIWAAHLLIEHFLNQVLVKPETESGTLIFSSPSSESGVMRRALFQVLGLVNDTPASSDKYQFARALAERLISKNRVKGDDILWETNKAALEAAFSRTVDLLTLSLEELHHQQELKEGSWFWALIHSVFLKNVGLFQQRLSLEFIGTCIHNVLYRAAKPIKATAELPPVQSSTSSVRRSNVSATAEKLAQELLWVTEKLKDCSSLSEPIRRWGAMHCLAKLSLSADPRIQACLLRVSVMLLNELAVSEPSTCSSSLKVNVLLLWLPLFCHAKFGFEYPCLMPSEKTEFSKNLEQNILSLSVLDQERVLACWLREYISSTSEWPNLQECFENWYFSIRNSADLSSF
ncbi:hypothetical protein GOP47_0012239 [Adiantum capillus-veneris]|uniref:At3g05675-like ankyrin-like domain-containing protein n=1 Tax=Adiantum capillus-veneris TaxID=13818 RepID=A0A9D4UQB1_ADICA|nr:hypothetical protein GOP47_0012239 [Adiantum capillus-veneris]